VMEPLFMQLIIVPPKLVPISRQFNTLFIQLLIVPPILLLTKLALGIDKYPSIVSPLIVPFEAIDQNNGLSIKTEIVFPLP